MALEQIVIQDKNLKYEMKLNRMVSSGLCKVLEYTPTRDNPFKNAYCLYFRNDLILTKLGRIQEGSMLESLFHNGYTVNYPHPLFQSVPSLPLTNMSQPISTVVRKLQNTYSPQELVYLLSFLDSFAPREKLMKLMRSYYYDYRRNGKFKKAFQILMGIQWYDSNDKWSHELANGMDYLKYTLQYEKAGVHLIELDPFLGELLLFKQLENPAAIEELMRLYNKRNLQKELVWIFLQGETILDQKECLHLLSTYFTLEEKWEILKEIVNKEPSSLFIDAFITSSKTLKKYEECFTLLVRFGKSKELDMETLLQEDLDVTKLDRKALFENAIQFLSTEHLETFLQTLLPSVLQVESLSTVFEWLEPLNEHNDTPPAYTTIKKWLPYKMT
ncbi:hypothetical protein Q73_02940 [Bacillus coahuilensis m2-6]|uniref:hypothetical protein n=1 Tax=Bacillus coahuilensis TaxID=408580 RepID=UPI00075049A7|nr:hypothetical protein [Bacillus coahuilensis]KUP09584.1 hypothetical protein Q73_02940 [Bacillus coahuilensis m2-6]